MELKDMGIIGVWIGMLGGFVWKAARQDKQITDNKEKIAEVKGELQTDFRSFTEEVKTGQTLIMSKLSEHHKVIHEKVDKVIESQADQGERVARIEGQLDLDGRKK